MERHLLDQIETVKDYEGPSEVDSFFEWVNTNERNDVERQFRDNGKHYQSVIGKVNSCVDSMEFTVGGELHNEIGVGNDIIGLLLKELKKQKLEHAAEDLKKFLNSPKSAGGAGCTPGQHHGGQFNGEIIDFLLNILFSWLYNFIIIFFMIDIQYISNYTLFILYLIPGKDVAKIFTLHDAMFQIIPEVFTKKDDFRILFATLNLIFKKVRLARFLNPQERSDLEMNVLNLSTIIFSRFKTMSITVKMHDVLVHTVKFVRKYHTIGLFSEQALESLHQIMHTDERKFLHLNKQPVTKIKSVMDQQNVRAALN